MFGPYIHQIDPILFDLAGVHVWWYGLGFAIGFLEIHLFLRRGHGRLHLSLRDVWSLSLFIAVGVLVGGRFVEITFDEWPFYREHLELIPAYWLGGMATHGLMFGGAVGAGLSVSNSSSGRRWKLDHAPAVGDPTHMVEFGTGRRAFAREA